ncbi:hypothetical protein BDD12DRAFT_806451 [Trichophaea hybrida]|nr:hypothetical protein BDD12DRAFT_806451 [Trichophaea hybrida]
MTVPLSASSNCNLFLCVVSLLSVHSGPFNVRITTASASTSPRCVLITHSLLPILPPLGAFSPSVYVSRYLYASSYGDSTILNRCLRVQWTARSHINNSDLQLGLFHPVSAHIYVQLIVSMSSPTPLSTSTIPPSTLRRHLFWAVYSTLTYMQLVYVATYSYAIVYTSALVTPPLSSILCPRLFHRLPLGPPVIFSLVLLELVPIVGGNSIQHSVSPQIFMFQICSPARRLLESPQAFKLYARPAPLSAGFQITGPAWPAKAGPKARESAGPVSNTGVDYYPVCVVYRKPSSTPSSDVYLTAVVYSTADVIPSSTYSPQQHDFETHSARA